MVDLSERLLDQPRAGGAAGRPQRVDARVVHLLPGAFDPTMLVPDPEGWIGLLVLDGLMMVRVDAGRAHVGSLVGADDVVVPWALEGISLTAGSQWETLMPTRIALLDRTFSVAACRNPALCASLVARTARTTSWLLAKSLVMACPVVEERLLLLFALLGERWGVVRRDGILLRLSLTHRLLATLCGVRRPSVTLALRGLQDAGVVARSGAGQWLLSHETAVEMASRLSCWPEYTNALGLNGSHLTEAAAP